MLRINRLIAVIILSFFMVITGSCGGGGGGGGNGNGGGGGEPAENFILTVDKFGEGFIISDVSGINCDNDCTESYPSGTTVVLTATTEGDSEFASWAGCDATSGSACTVTMDRDRIIFPTFAREAYILEETTKILDDDTLQYLVYQEESTYYFDPQATAVLDLEPGDIIAGSTGKGFLSKVTLVYISADGLIAVQTTDATLEDAIKEGTVAFTKKLTHADLTSSKKMIEGASLRKAADASSTEFTIDFDTTVYNLRPAFDFDYPVGDYTRISGSVTLTLEPDFALDLCFCFNPVEEFKTVLITTNINEINVTVEGGASGDIVAPILIGTLPFGPFPVFPPPPSLPLVWLTPEINIYVGVDGSAEATLTTGVQMTNVLTTGVRYTKDAGWEKISGFSWERASEFDLSSLLASASVRGYVRPECVIWINSFAGPYFNLDVYLRLAATASSDVLWWGLYAGLDASAGARVKIFSASLRDYGPVDLFDPNPEWKLASDTVTIGNTPPTATITIPSNGSSYTQGESITFSGSGYDAEDGTLSGGSLVWTSSIDGQIGTGTSFTKSDLSVGMQTITLTATDSEGATGNASLNITITETATPLSITTTSLSSGTVGVSYPATNLSATGGKIPYSWSILSGSLPPSLSLSISGIISGTFTTAGTYNFTVQVTDSSSPQQTASKALSIVVNPVNTPTITSVTPGSGTQGQTLGVIILGTNLTGATSVSFGAGITVNSFTVNSSTQITANISISSTATTGARNVSVTTPAGTGTGSGLFSVTSSQIFTLTVTKAGNGSGTVTSSPAGINCGGTCSAIFNQGETVTLTLTPSAGSAFEGWSSACTGTGTCTVTMDADKAVTATFNTSNDTTPPSVPTSLTATTVSSSQINLSWNVSTDNVGVAGYKIYRNSSYLKSVSTTSTSDTGLSPSTQYCYKVSAYDAAGNESGQSSQVCTTTNSSTTTPAAPSSLLAVALSSSQISLTWQDNSNNETGFKLDRKTGTSGTYAQIGTQGQNLNFYNNTGLNAGTQYCYRVRAYNSAGDSNYSNENCATTSATCSVPGSFTISANAYCKNQTTPAVMITGINSSGMSTFDLYRNGSLYSPSNTGTYFDNFANVVAGQTYTYYVVAKNSCGSTQSNTVTVTVPSNVCSSTPVERINNGSFSSGTSGWILSGDFWADTNLDRWRTAPGYAAGGVDSAGSPKINASGYMYQTVTIPSGATSTILSFWLNITSDESTTTIQYDKLYVEVLNSSGTLLATLATYSNLDKGPYCSPTCIYNQKNPFNLISYKGQTIRIQFRATTDSALDTVFRIDDVSLMSDGN